MSFGAQCPHAEDTARMPRLLKPIWADSGHVENPSQSTSRPSSAPANRWRHDHLGQNRRSRRARWVVSSSNRELP